MRSLLALGVVGVAVVVAGALAWQLLGSRNEELAPTSVVAFDPFGTGAPGENDGDAALATDGDIDTSWSTETYRDPDLASYKQGVGLVLDLGGRHIVDGLDVASPSSGWTAEAYVLDDPPGADVGTWGEARGRSEGIDGDTGLDLGGADGRYVLLWITRTADDGTVRLSEMSVTVRT